MIDRNEMEVTISWAKVTHKNRVKRINRPSQDFKTFLGQVRAHFKELLSVEYMYTPEGKKSETDGKSSQFVLRWQSQSPTDMSMLDQSINAVEVTSQDQYFEILCTHCIVDKQRNNTSTPRFSVYVIEPAGQERPAGIEAALGEQMDLSMSPIVVKKATSDDDKPAAVANQQ